MDSRTQPWTKMGGTHNGWRNRQGHSERNQQLLYSVDDLLNSSANAAHHSSQAQARGLFAIERSKQLLQRLKDERAGRYLLDKCSVAHDNASKLNYEQFLSEVRDAQNRSRKAVDLTRKLAQDIALIKSKLELTRLQFEALR